MSHLGPKPRIAAGGANDLQFYSGGPAPAASGFGAPVQPPQPVQQPFYSAPQPTGSPPGQPVQPFFQSSSQPPSGMVGGSMGQQQQQQPGSFPQPGQAQGNMQAGKFPPPQQSYGYDDDIENEPPLLEELGINVEHIVMRMKGIAFFKQIDGEVLRDADLMGPIVIILTLCMCLLLRGKLQFGYVYGFSGTGCLGIWMLVYVMSQSGGIDVLTTASLLVYGLIPIILVAVVAIVLSLRGPAGMLLSGGCIFWATASSSRFFAKGFLRPEQKWLVAYPIGVFYTCFVLLVVF